MFALHAPGDAHSTRPAVRLLAAVAALVTIAVLPTTDAAAATGRSGASEVRTGPAATADLAVAYQINPAHDGFSAGGVAPPPLRKRWSRDLGGEISYPIIAAGRVFVTAARSSGYGTVLYGLDAGTGADAWAPIPLDHTYWWSALTFGDGRLFALTYNGDLSAIDPRTGALLWRVRLAENSSFNSAPTYRDGIVHVGGGGDSGRLYAVNARTGAVRWTAPVINGEQSSPAVTDTGVYVSYTCERSYAFEPGTGAPIWHRDTPCWGGGGKTAVVADGGLWVRDSSAPPTVLNLADGTVRATFGPVGDRPVAPAFAGTTGFFLSRGVLQARSTATPAQPFWSFAGDGMLASAPIVVNGHVYIGEQTGKLWALDPATGAPVWSTDVGAAITEPDEQNVSQPLTGLAAGQGRLVVPASNLLVAYSG